MVASTSAMILLMNRPPKNVVQQSAAVPQVTATAACHDRDLRAKTAMMKSPSMPPESRLCMTHQVLRIESFAGLKRTTASAMPTEKSARATVIARRNRTLLRGLARFGAKRFQ